MQSSPCYTQRRKKPASLGPEASISSTSHPILEVFSPKPRGSGALPPPPTLGNELTWEVTPHRPTPREALELREFGTWEVNSLIKTVQKS